MKLKLLGRSQRLDSIPSTGSEVQTMDAFYPYAEMLNAAALALLLLLVAVVYFTLTMQAFTVTSDGRSANTAWRRDGAGIDCRRDEDRLRPLAVRSRRSRAFSKA
jgi:hypothetical protein